MAGSLNKVMLIGNLGADPEIRTMNNGDRTCSLRLATSESWKDRQSGERKESTEWHSVSIWNPNLVAVCEKYLKKGSTIYVEGQLKTRKWKDRDGNERYTTEINIGKFGGALTMLGGRNESSGGSGGDGYGSRRESQDTTGGSYDDDEIPF